MSRSADNANLRGAIPAWVLVGIWIVEIGERETQGSGLSASRGLTDRFLDYSSIIKFQRHTM
ncbi:MAG: hypothetical protein HGB20_08215 [Chlorobiaceae bacterium]|nr:hypothetical protein [Chlorobiaceae bacterium]